MIKRLLCAAILGCLVATTAWAQGVGFNNATRLKIIQSFQWGESCTDINTGLNYLNTAGLTAIDDFTYKGRTYLMYTDGVNVFMVVGIEGELVCHYAYGYYTYYEGI